MPSEEKTLEYAREKGWDKIFEKVKILRTLHEVETAIGRKISDVEIRAMCSLGLAQIMAKEKGGYALVLTGLGLKLLENKTPESVSVNNQELQESLWLIEKKWHLNFLKFIETGEASNEFLDYLDSNSDAQRAVGLVMTAQIRALEYVREVLKVHRLVNRYFRGKNIQEWLNTSHPLLDNKTPQSLMNDGHADAVLVLLESVRDGTPL